MALTLSSADLSRLHEAQTVLLAPLAAPTLAAWSARAVETLSDLLGADSGFMLLPFSDTPLVERGIGRDIDETVAHYILDPQATGGPFPDPTMELCTQVRLARGIHTLSYDQIDHLIGGSLATSPYYNDFQAVHPHRGAAVLLADLVRDATAVEGAVHLFFQKASVFGDQTLAVQTLLVPALCAGVGAAVDLYARRAALDALDTPLVVCDVDGRVVHETPALTDALAGDDRAASVRAEVLRLAADLMAPDPTALPERTVRTDRGLYGLHATILPEGGTFGPRPGVLVGVRVPASPWPSTDVLRDRAGLTRREADVALGLAQGLSNDRLAEVLCISPHTARRHTERVMAKLGVASRSSVAAALLDPSGIGG